MYLAFIKMEEQYIYGIQYSELNAMICLGVTQILLSRAVRVYRTGQLPPQNAST